MLSGLPLFPVQASTLAPEVDHLYFGILAVTSFFAILVTIIVLYFGMKYKDSTGERVGAPIHGSVPLELLWSFIPFLIAMVIFAFIATSYAAISLRYATRMRVVAAGAPRSAALSEYLNRLISVPYASVDAQAGTFTTSTGDFPNTRTITVSTSGLTKTVTLILTPTNTAIKPDTIVIPGGNLGNVSALGAGFDLMIQLGLITKRPRIVVAQAEAAKITAVIGSAKPLPAAQRSVLVSDTICLMQSIITDEWPLISRHTCAPASIAACVS